jgi:hypothetical protein
MQRQFARQPGVQATAAHLKIASEINFDQQVSHQAGSAWVGGHKGIFSRGGRRRQLGRGPTHHHVVAQLRRAVVGQRDQGLVNGQAATQTQVGVPELRGHLAGNDHAPIGAVAQSQGFGLDVQRHRQAR